MKKQEVKNILMSIRTHENEETVNYLLGRLDMKDEEWIENACKRIGDNEESIRNFFIQKIQQLGRDLGEKQIPINDMFSYGISDNTIHLHLPKDLQQLIEEYGRRKTLDIVNLNLLDAIDRINRLRSGDFYRFKGKERLYMISPALISVELRFLEGLDFETHSYSRKQLGDNDFVEENPEARLATQIFGSDKHVGTASISFDTINSSKWQEKKKQVVEDLKRKGITLQKEEKQQED